MNCTQEHARVQGAGTYILNARSSSAADEGLFKTWKSIQ